MVLYRQLGLRPALEDGIRAPRIVAPVYSPPPPPPPPPPPAPTPAPVVQAPVYFPPPPPTFTTQDYLSQISTPPPPVFSPPPPPPPAYTAAQQEPIDSRDLAVTNGYGPRANLITPVFSPPPPPPPPPPAPIVQQPAPVDTSLSSDWRTGGREAQIAELSGGEFTAKGNFNYAKALPSPSTPPPPPAYSFSAPSNEVQRANNVLSLENLDRSPVPETYYSPPAPPPPAAQEPTFETPPVAGLSNPPPAPVEQAAAPAAAPALTAPAQQTPAAAYTDPTPVYEPQAPTQQEQTQAAPTPTASNPGSSASAANVVNNSAAAAAASAAIRRLTGSRLFNTGNIGLHIPKIGMSGGSDSDPSGSGQANGELQAVAFTGSPMQGGLGTFNTGFAGEDKDKEKSLRMKDGLPVFEDGGVMPEQQQAANLQPDDPRMMEMNIQEAARNNPQQIQQIQQAVMQAIQSGELTMEELNQMVQLAKLAMQNPEAWPQIRQYAIEQGVAEDDEIPQQYDKGLLYVILLAGKAVQDMAVAPNTNPQATSGPMRAGLIPKFENGGVVPTQLNDGHKLAYIKPGEAVLHQGVVAAMGRKWVESQNAKWNKDGTPVEKPAKSS